MENIRVKPDEAGFVFENPYMLDPNDLLQPVLSDPEAVLPKGWKTYLEPQVLLIDRVYPPLPPRAALVRCSSLGVSQSATSAKL